MSQPGGNANRIVDPLNNVGVDVACHEGFVQFALGLLLLALELLLLVEFCRLDLGRHLSKLCGTHET
jgi:hypothetical protein